MRNTSYNDFSGGTQADLQAWLLESAGDNTEQLSRLRRNLRAAREQELTARQKLFLQMHFDEGKPFSQIARELHINRSTVCRTVARAKKRLYRCLRYGL